jgi:hypothetical protein
MKITRRRLAAAVLAPPVMAIQEQTKPLTATDEVSAAGQQLNSALETLDRFDLDISAEPAFIFKAS